MATIPGPLIWEAMELLVFVLARRPTISSNLNSYKHSGLANHKTVTIQPRGKDSSVLLATTKTKRQNKPAALFHKSLLKKEFPRMAKAVTNQLLRGLVPLTGVLRLPSLVLRRGIDRPQRPPAGSEILKRIAPGFIFSPAFLNLIVPFLEEKLA